MRAELDATSSLQERTAVVRRYGYGVPNFDRAILSALNDLTLVIEDRLHPFKRGQSQIMTRDMMLHALPWPRDELLQLGEALVELRVTLSYFIEPNPGERGWTRRHRYASHGLRFRVKRALETEAQFRARINKAARDEEEGFSASGSDAWLLGPRLRDRGSIHSDVWRGTAVDLAARDAVGVYPVGGWWKEKPALDRWHRRVRYALIVSVRASGMDIDLYTPVAQKVATPAAIIEVSRGS